MGPIQSPTVLGVKGLCPHPPASQVGQASPGILGHRHPVLGIREAKLGNGLEPLLCLAHLLGGSVQLQARGIWREMDKGRHGAWGWGVGDRGC